MVTANLIPLPSSAPAPEAPALEAQAAKVAVVAIEMGYGHLRPARSLGRELNVEIMHTDRPPLADAEEQRRWQSTRRLYESMSRVSGIPWLGPPLRGVLNSITDIPNLYPFRDLSGATLGVKLLERAARQGLGRSIVAYLQKHDLALLTTFYSPAVLADFHGYDRIFCVVTDSDVNRVWAPIRPASSKIHYLAPSGRVVRRLRAYGVRESQIELTGFPLPHSLVGGPEAPTLRKNLLQRLARLDPTQTFRQAFAADLEHLGPLPPTSEPPHLVFAVGGSGAQAELSASFLPSLRPLLERRRLRLTLVAGVRRGVKIRFEDEVARAGLSPEARAQREHFARAGARRLLRPLRRAARGHRYPVDQAERAGVLRRARHSALARATSGHSRELQPALGARKRRGLQAARRARGRRSLARAPGRRKPRFGRVGRLSQTAEPRFVSHRRARARIHSALIGEKAGR